MAWLLRDGQVLASLEIADSLVERVKGPLGRDRSNGALLIRRVKGAHGFGVRSSLDVAYLDAKLVVVRTRRMRPFTVAPPIMRARDVLLAEDGAFERWSLKRGDHLEIKG